LDGDDCIAFGKVMAGRVQPTLLGDFAMTIMGWIVVLGPLAAYGLMWLVWWRSLQNGPREWADANPPTAPSEIEHRQVLSIAAKKMSHPGSNLERSRAA
jgi:hypothetical protein